MPIRIRQHVNPLARKFQQPIAVPNWQDIYAQVDRPWHLDIGCARGKFLLDMAKSNPEVNFLGIEIRSSLVELANRERDQFNLTNLHYLFGNMNSSAPVILESLPVNSLHTISIQFPDPWFKKKHNKRRVVQPELVTILVDYLVPGGKVFLQSDIKEVAEQMRDRFLMHSLMGQRACPHVTPKTAVHRFAANLQLKQQHQTTWLEHNPFPVATERELYVLAQDLPVYRALFQKTVGANGRSPLN
ncbi:MAG: tRNA (guanosine(46)-N7)-methyltransferase TrmB [Cyanobacteria bacterium P01_A01_bin.83]